MMLPTSRTVPLVECWDEDGEIFWTNRDPAAPRNADRWAAMRHYLSEVGDYDPPRALARWMRRETKEQWDAAHPERHPADHDLWPGELVEPWPYEWDEVWWECKRDHPDAVPVWRIEP